MVVDVSYGSSVLSFGNSIPTNYGVQEILTAWLGGSLEKRGIPDAGIKRINLCGYQHLPYGTRSSLVTWDGHLNDVRRHGAAALPCIAPALNAFLSCAFMGGARTATHPSVVKTGSWTTLDANHNGFGAAASRPHGTLNRPAANSAIRTSDASATASFTFTGPRVAVHAFGTENSGGNELYKNLNVTIDGVTHLFEVEDKALPGEVSCPIAMMFRDLGPGYHTITVSPVDGGNYTAFDAFGYPQPAGFAPVVLAHAPYMLNWLNATPELIDASNAIVDQVAEEWAADGFPVSVARTNDFYVPSRDAGRDGLHPSTNGRKNYALAQIAAIRVK